MDAAKSSPSYCIVLHARLHTVAVLSYRSPGSSVGHCCEYETIRDALEHTVHFPSQDGHTAKGNDARTQTALVWAWACPRSLQTSISSSRRSGRALAPKGISLVLAGAKAGAWLMMAAQREAVALCHYVLQPPLLHRRLWSRNIISFQQRAFPPSDSLGSRLLLCDDAILIAGCSFLSVALSRITSLAYSPHIAGEVMLFIPEHWYWRRAGGGGSCSYNIG